MTSQLKPRSKSFEMIAVVVVLALSALLARGLLGGSGSDALAKDLRTVLGQFYDCPNVDVKLTPTGGSVPMVNVQLQLALPAGARGRRSEWVCTLGRFVASRHPEVKVERWSGSANGQALADTPPALSGRREGLGSPDYQEAARSELARRQAQTQVDQLLGPGAALVLVDVAAASPSASEQKLRVESREVGMEKRLPTEDRESRPGPGTENRLMAPEEQKDRAAGAMERVAPSHRQPTFEIGHIEAYLVVGQSAAPESVEKAKGVLRGSLGLVEGRGDSIKVVTLLLPALPTAGATR